MGEDAVDSSEQEDHTPTPLLDSENAFFHDFDAHFQHAQPDGATSSSNPSDDEDLNFDIPYDRNHRPQSSFGPDLNLPTSSSKPLTIINPDESRATSPTRGRTRDRQIYDVQTKHVAPSPLRDAFNTNDLANSVFASAVPNLPHEPVATSAMSRNTEASDSDSSVFDEPTYDQQDDHYTDPTDMPSRGASADDAPGSYDLKPPPPSHEAENVEYMSERLFSSDHLRHILKDPNYSTRFNSFLAKYRPESRIALEQYASVQKAVSALDYANAIAESIGGPGTTAAHQDEDFEAISRKSVEDLVDNALPGYVTHRLVQIVTEVLVKEITGQSTPFMRELVNGLAEVYCLTDPALPDNPIVYASEEFYRCTQYGKNYVIGRNCRFLQGPKTANSSVQRLVDALGEGQEICETILNYRRDGSPFMNLLMIAPLYDNKGAVRYFIGAQIDVNGLIEGGRGIDSFEKLLQEDKGQDRYAGRGVSKKPEEALSDLAGLWNEDDLESINGGGGAGASRRGKGSTAGGSGTTTPVKRKAAGNTRRFVGMDDPTDQGLWPAPSLGPSGRLPGVFQNYLLIRPYPSLRITFTSPAMRIPGLLQSKFLDRIGGRAAIRDQILDALSSGIGVTAKIVWLPHANSSSKDGDNQGGAYRENDEGGRQRWIHCTPLLGSDDKVGVWMVVMVENETVTGGLNRQQNGNQGRDQSDRASQRGRPNQSQQQQPQTMDSIQRRQQSLQSQPSAPRQPSNSAHQAHLSHAAEYAQPQQRPTSSGEQMPYRPGYGSPKVFPGELKPITSAYADRSVSTAGGGSQGQSKEQRAKRVQERATAGEESFRDF